MAPGPILPLVDLCWHRECTATSATIPCLQGAAQQPLCDNIVLSDYGGPLPAVSFVLFFFWGGGDGGGTCGEEGAGPGGKVLGSSWVRGHCKGSPRPRRPFGGPEHLSPTCGLGTSFLTQERIPKPTHADK